MNCHKLLKLVISGCLAFLLLAGCSAQTTPAATYIPSTATTTPVQPTATLTSTPPSPTVEPLFHQTKIEVITNNAVTGDGGNSWGGHQTRIVHTQDGIFTAYTVEGEGYLNREWRLATRQIDGKWVIVAEGESGREPVNLLASPDGTLHIIGWPNGLATIWSGKPENGTLEMTPSSIPSQLNGNWPYNSAGIDANGNLCVLSSEGGEHPGGRFYLACYLPTKAKWVTQTSTLDFRFCYTYVFPAAEGQLSLVSTRDVRWEALDYKKPSGNFDYIFNALGFWRTDDISKTPPKRIYFQEEKPTTQYPDPILNAQQDAYIDTKGQMHIIYHIQGESTRGDWVSRHAIISLDGQLIDDVQLPDAAGDFLRIFQDQEGQFYLLGSSGNLYPMGLDGLQVDKPIRLNLGGNQVEYSGFGVSVPRTGSPLSNVIDVVFPSANGTKWLYFQLDFSSTFSTATHLANIASPTGTNIRIPVSTVTLTPINIPISTAIEKSKFIAGVWEGTTTRINNGNPISERVTTVSIPLDCQLGKDCGFFITENAPANTAYAKTAVTAKYAALKTAPDAKLAAQNARAAARDVAAAEWDFHNTVLAVKEQVIAQFGKSSDQV